MAAAAAAASPEDADDLTACQMWEVVGGADKGGIIVRQGRETTSQQLAQRLATSAIVCELQVAGDRLHFRRLFGTGPDEGWVSTSLKDKVLACRVAQPDRGALTSGCGTDEIGEEPPFPEMAPVGVDALPEELEELRTALEAEAAEAAACGELPTALARLTAALQLGAATARLYGRRGEVLLRLGRPRAAINDCAAALALNPNQAKALKTRARANTSLKRWAEAHADFQEALKIDYDDPTWEESKPVGEKMREIAAVAAERRRRDDEAVAAARHAEVEARLRERRDAAARLAEEKAARDLLERRFAPEPFYKLAKRNGYMIDFMGMNRGPCKCKRCDFYLWRPVRMSS